MAHRQDAAQVKFAIEVTTQLQAHASAVAADESVRGSFPSQLAGLAFHVQQNLQQLLDSPETRPKQTSRGVSQYLEIIEKLYQVLSRKALGITVLKSFATDPRTTELRKKLTKSVERFLKTIATIPTLELSNVTLPEQTNTVRDDFQSHIRSLYAALSSHCLCHESNTITANLRLNKCCTPGEIENSINFKLLFLDHPHSRTSDPRCQWQDARICVVQRRGVKFRDAILASTSQSKHGQLISSDAFCQLITRRAQSQLMLTVSEKGLVLDGHGLPSQSLLLRSSSISLAELLQVTRLDPKMRLLLSYTIAKAFWQFYGTDWMQKEWTKDTVHFMFEKLSTIPKGLLINEPFLSAQFGKPTCPDSEDEARIHSFPKILALGIMLIEIELGISLEERRTADHNGIDGLPTVNTNLLTASDTFKDVLKQNSAVFKPLVEAIETCLKPDRFNEYQNDVASLREALMKLIVDPIEQLYMVAWEDPDKSDVRPISVPTSDDKDVSQHCHLPSPPPEIPVQISSSHFATWENGPQPRPYLQHLSGSHTPSQSPHSQVRGTISEHTSGLSSDVWFEQLDDLNSVLRARRQETDALWRKSRVAILDTGVHEDLYDSDGMVKDYKDFVGNDDQMWRDNVGHGTNAVRLTKKVYNMAEIYVARVFETSQASNDTEALMAQAIHHATDVWNADVIVMPSGFRSHHQEIMGAIEKANHCRVLVFAAASNYGNSTEIAFPGRLYTHGKLFCMFSTDANVRCLQSLNPSPLATARHSFAILGENIVLHPNEPSLSGTSFSTIIAGALAARLLDFSRQRGIREQIRHRDRMETVEGMSAVFSAMVMAVDNRYHCMTPWKILPNISEPEPTRRRHKRRDYIGETISRALDNLY
ncbi:hypothetical protein PFICI_08862 [Pestalotiopsis fici W106-1]|uniref:DUF7580 domain-containing protein n=1 Tax=Pestalotiopsis fici (strain W106-1 / CGMCC3.15140) TaxID=1229662 RepID=W3WYZ7_PESFW|nr:uncharacterized protein PFICI_08862 [Pestalotiopsis fici W106-1]ETS79009.1 hypothetical protein PFICI_08862 [Pestalotiopsis fici W106-1]